MNPPLIAEQNNFDRGNCAAWAAAAGLAGAGQVGAGLAVGGLRLFWNARRHGRKLSAAALARFAGIVFLAFLAGHLLHNWSDVKTGFLEGYFSATRR